MRVINGVICKELAAAAEPCVINGALWGWYVAAGGGLSIPVAMGQMNQFNGGTI